MLVVVWVVVVVVVVVGPREHRLISTSGGSEEGSSLLMPKVGIHVPCIIFVYLPLSGHLSISIHLTFFGVDRNRR